MTWISNNLYPIFWADRFFKLGSSKFYKTFILFSSRYRDVKEGRKYGPSIFKILLSLRSKYSKASKADLFQNFFKFYFPWVLVLSILSIQCSWFPFFKGLELLETGDCLDSRSLILCFLQESTMLISEEKLYFSS